MCSFVLENMERDCNEFKLRITVGTIQRLDCIGFISIIHGVHARFFLRKYCWMCRSGCFWVREATPLINEKHVDKILVTNAHATI